MTTQLNAMLVYPPPLDGLRVGISGAVPERSLWGEVGDLDRLILTFVAQLSALIVRYGGKVVHGSQPLLAPVVAEQARRQSREGTPSLMLFASQVFGPIPEVTLRAASMAHADVVLTAQVGKGGSSDPETRNNSLTAMRLAMTQNIDVLVAVGGKLHADTGFNPGVLEELAHARWHSVPCFVVGAFSGAAGSLEHPILEELSTGNLLGTETVPAISMATWTDTMDAYTGKLLVHLARHRSQFVRRRPVEYEYGSSTFQFSSGVMTVDPKTVGVWSARFAKLMQSIEKRDINQTRMLLRP